MFEHSVVHSPKNHAGEYTPEERVALREKLLGLSETKVILGTVNEVIQHLQCSYPDQLAAYKEKLSKLPPLTRLAKKLFFDAEEPPAPNGFALANEIADILEREETEVSAMMEDMHQADLLERRREIVLAPPTVTGAFASFVENGLGYRLTDLGREVLTKN